MTFDFKNAFSSTSPDLFLSAMKQKGLSPQFYDLIEETYTGSITRLYTKEGRSDTIDIKIGTKQGCQMSPQLFNLCLEPLFAAFEKLHAKDGYSISETCIPIQAYADDIILISDSVSLLNAMIKTCE